MDSSSRLPPVEAPPSPSSEEHTSTDASNHDRRDRPARDASQATPEEGGANRPREDGGEVSETENPSSVVPDSAIAPSSRTDSVLDVAVFPVASRSCGELAHFGDNSGGGLGGEPGAGPNPLSGATLPFARSALVARDEPHPSSSASVPARGLGDLRGLDLWNGRVAEPEEPPDGDSFRETALPSGSEGREARAETAEGEADGDTDSSLRRFSFPVAPPSLTRDFAPTEERGSRLWGRAKDARGSLSLPPSQAPALAASSSSSSSSSFPPSSASSSSASSSLPSSALPFLFRAAESEGTHVAWGLGGEDAVADCFDFPSESMAPSPPLAESPRPIPAASSASASCASSASGDVAHTSQDLLPESPASSGVYLPSYPPLPTFADEMRVFASEAQLVHLLNVCARHLEALDGAFFEERAGRSEGSSRNLPMPWSPQVSRASLPTLREALDTYAGSLVHLDRLLDSLLETAAPATILLAASVIVEQLEDPELLLSLFSTFFATLGDTEAHQRLLPCIAPLRELLPSAEPDAAAPASPASPAPAARPDSPCTSRPAPPSSGPFVPFSALEAPPSACVTEVAAAFLSRLSSLPLARSRCGQVWDGEHVAYRCLTCGGSQSSCICVFCFQEGNHLGHSYFIYRSSCGGCCDCGDASAWAPSGFCRHHPGSHRDVDPSVALPTPCKFALVLLLRVLVRRLAMHALDKNWIATQELCATLLQLSEQHEGIRRCIGQAMLEAVRGTPDDSRGFANAETPGAERLFLPPNYARYDGWQALLLNRALALSRGGASVSEEEEFARRATEGAARAAEAQAKAEQAEKAGGRGLLGEEAERRMRLATDRELREIEERKKAGGVNVKSFDDALRFAMWGGESARRPENGDTHTLGPRDQGRDAEIRRREGNGADREPGVNAGNGEPPRERKKHEKNETLEGKNELPSDKSGRRSSTSSSSSSSASVSSAYRHYGIGACVASVLLKVASDISGRLIEDEDRRSSDREEAESEETKTEKAVHASLTTLWLALMFDEWFKEQFAFVFIQKYRDLVLKSDSALERVTVQVLSIRSLLTRLLYSGLLLPLLFSSCRLVLGQAVPQLPPRGRDRLSLFWRRRRCTWGGYPSPPYIDIKNSLLHRRGYTNSLNDVRYLVAEKDLLVQYLSEHPSNVAALWDDGFLPLYCLSQNVNLHRRRTTTHVEYEDSHRWSHALCLAIELGQNALALHEILEACPWPVAVLIFQKTRQRLQAWIGATRRRECVEEGISWVFASDGGVAPLLARERTKQRTRAEGTRDRPSQAETEREIQRETQREIQRETQRETEGEARVARRADAAEIGGEANACASDKRQKREGDGGGQSGATGDERDDVESSVYPEHRSLDHFVSRHPTSFHIPLSRLLAQLLKALMVHRACPVETLEELLELLGVTMEDRIEALEHHFRTLVFFHQVTTCSMWVRNGLAVVSEAQCYRRAFYQSVLIDLDLTAARLGCCSIPPPLFLLHLLAKCDVPFDLALSSPCPSLLSLPTSSGSASPRTTEEWSAEALTSSPRGLTSPRVPGEAGDGVYASEDEKAADVRLVASLASQGPAPYTAPGRGGRETGQPAGLSRRRESIVNEVVCGGRSNEHLLPQTHAFMVLLLQFLYPTNSLFCSEEDMMTYLLRHHLMRGPQTHSSLQDVVTRPYKQQPQFTDLVDRVLKKISTYRGAEGMTPGQFHIHSASWAFYDPYFPYFSWADHQHIEEAFLEQIKSHPEILNQWLPHPSTDCSLSSSASLCSSIPKAYRSGFFTFCLSPAVRSAVWLLTLQVLLAQSTDHRFIHLLLSLLLRLMSLDIVWKERESAEARQRLLARQRADDLMRRVLHQRRRNRKQRENREAERDEGEEGEGRSTGVANEAAQLRSSASHETDDETADESEAKKEEEKAEGTVIELREDVDLLGMARWMGTNLGDSLVRTFQLRHVFLDVSGRHEARWFSRRLGTRRHRGSAPNGDASGKAGEEAETAAATESLGRRGGRGEFCAVEGASPTSSGESSSDGRETEEEGLLEERISGRGDGRRREPGERRASPHRDHQDPRSSADEEESVNLDSDDEWLDDRRAGQGRFWIDQSLGRGDGNGRERRGHRASEGYGGGAVAVSGGRGRQGGRRNGGTEERGAPRARGTLFWSASRGVFFPDNEGSSEASGEEEEDMMTYIEWGGSAGRRSASRREGPEDVEMEDREDEPGEFNCRDDGLDFGVRAGGDSRDASRAGRNRPLSPASLAGGEPVDAGPPPLSSLPPQEAEEPASSSQTATAASPPSDFSESLLRSVRLSTASSCAHCSSQSQGFSTPETALGDSKSVRHSRSSSTSVRRSVVRGDSRQARCRPEAREARQRQKGWRRRRRRLASAWGTNESSVEGMLDLLAQDAFVLEAEGGEGLDGQEATSVRGCGGEEGAEADLIVSENGEILYDREDAHAPRDVFVDPLLLALRRLRKEESDLQGADERSSPPSPPCESSASQSSAPKTSSLFSRTRIGSLCLLPGAAADVARRLVRKMEAEPWRKPGIGAAVPAPGASAGGDSSGETGDTRGEREAARDGQSEGVIEQAMEGEDAPESHADDEQRTEFLILAAPADSSDSSSSWEETPGTEAAAMEAAEAASMMRVEPRSPDGNRIQSFAELFRFPLPADSSSPGSASAAQPDSLDRLGVFTDSLRQQLVSILHDAGVTDLEHAFPSSSPLSSSSSSSLSSSSSSSAASGPETLAERRSEGESGDGCPSGPDAVSASGSTADEPARREGGEDALSQACTDAPRGARGWQLLLLRAVAGGAQSAERNLASLHLVARRLLSGAAHGEEGGGEDRPANALSIVFGRTARSDLARLRSPPGASDRKGGRAQPDSKEICAALLRLLQCRKRAPSEFPFLVRFSMLKILFAMRQSPRFEAHWQQLDWVLQAAGRLDARVERQIRQWRRAAAAAAGTPSPECGPVAGGPLSPSLGPGEDTARAGDAAAGERGLASEGGGELAGARGRDEGEGETVEPEESLREGDGASPKRAGGPGATDAEASVRGGDEARKRTEDSGEDAKRGEEWKEAVRRRQEQVLASFRQKQATFQSGNQRDFDEAKFLADSDVPRCVSCRLEEETLLTFLSSSSSSFPEDYERIFSAASRCCSPFHSPGADPLGLLCHVQLTSVGSSARPSVPPCLLQPPWALMSSASTSAGAGAADVSRATASRAPGAGGPSREGPGGGAAAGGAPRGRSGSDSASGAAALSGPLTRGSGRSRAHDGSAVVAGAAATAEFGSRSRAGREDSGDDDTRFSCLSMVQRREGLRGAKNSFFEASAVPAILEDVASPASYSYDLVPNLLSPQGAFHGFQIRSCGHRMHLSCYRRYQKSQQHHMYLSELLLPCPYCHQPCNLLLVDAPPPAVARLELQRLLTDHVLKKAREQRAQRSLAADGDAGASPSGPRDSTGPGGLALREGQGGQGYGGRTTASWSSPSAKAADAKGPVSTPAARAVAGGPAPFFNGEAEDHEDSPGPFSDSEDTKKSPCLSPVSWKRTLARFVRRCEKLRSDRERLLPLLWPASCSVVGLPSVSGAPLRLQSLLLHTAAASDLLHLCRASLRISPLHLPAPILWSPSSTSLRTSSGTVGPAGATFSGAAGARRFAGFFSFSSPFGSDTGACDSTAALSGAARLSEALFGADCARAPSLGPLPRCLPLAVPAWGGIPTGLQGAAPRCSVGRAGPGPDQGRGDDRNENAVRQGDDSEDANLGPESGGLAHLSSSTSALLGTSGGSSERSRAAPSDGAALTSEQALSVEGDRRDRLHLQAGAEREPCRLGSSALLPHSSVVSASLQDSPRQSGGVATTGTKESGTRLARNEERLSGLSSREGNDEREGNGEGGCLLWTPQDVGGLFGHAACTAQPPVYGGAWPRNDFVVHPLAVVSKLISDSVEHTEMALRSQPSGDQGLSTGRAEVLHGCYAVYLHLADEFQHVAVGDTGVTAFDLYVHDLELMALFHCPLFPSPLAEPLSPSATATSPVPTYASGTVRKLGNPTEVLNAPAGPPQISPLSASSSSSSSSLLRPATKKWVSFGGLLPSDACSYVDLVLSLSLLHPSTRFHLLSRLFLAFHALALRAKADEKAGGAGRHLRAAIDAAERGARAAEFLLLGSEPSAETGPSSRSAPLGDGDADAARGRGRSGSAPRRPEPTGKGDRERDEAEAGDQPEVGEEARESEQQEEAADGDERRARRPRLAATARRLGRGAQGGGAWGTREQARARVSDLASETERPGGREGRGWLSLNTALREIEEEIAAALGRDEQQSGDGAAEANEAKEPSEQGDSRDAPPPREGLTQGVHRVREAQETPTDVRERVVSGSQSALSSGSRPETCQPLSTSMGGGLSGHVARSPGQNGTAQQPGRRARQTPSPQRAFLEVLELYVQLFFLSEVIAILWQWWDRLPFPSASVEDGTGPREAPDAAAKDGSATAWQEIWRVLHLRATQHREGRMAATSSPHSAAPAPHRGRRNVPASVASTSRSLEEALHAHHGRVDEDAPAPGAWGVSAGGFASSSAGTESAERRSEGRMEKSGKRRSASRKAEEDDAGDGADELGRRRRKRNCEEDGAGSGPGAAEEESERRIETGGLPTAEGRDEVMRADGEDAGREGTSCDNASNEALAPTARPLAASSQPEEAAEKPRAPTSFLTHARGEGTTEQGEEGATRRERREKLGTEKQRPHVDARKDVLASQSFVTRWSQEVEGECLEWEGDSAVLEETRQADGLSASVWLEDLRLLGRRLPYPPRKEQLGVAAWRVRFDENGTDERRAGEAGQAASEGRGNSPLPREDAALSASPGASLSQERTGEKEELLTKDYLLSVYTARTDRAEELKSCVPSLPGRLPLKALSRATLGGLKPSSVDRVTPPFGLLEGTRSVGAASDLGDGERECNRRERGAEVGEQSSPGHVDGEVDEGMQATQEPAESGFPDQDRKNVICRIVEAGLVPWLRKVHLLAKVVCPSQPLPFEEIKTAYEMLGPSSPSDAAVLRTPQLPASSASFPSASPRVSPFAPSSLSDLVSPSVDLYDPSEECGILLEALPLPKSIRLFLFGEDDDIWGGGETASVERKRADEGTRDHHVIAAALRLPSPTAWPRAVTEAHALRLLLRESQFLCCLASLPPCSTSLTTLMPIVVSSRSGHETLVRLFQSAMRLVLSEKAGGQVPLPSSSLLRVSSSSRSPLSSPPSPFFGVSASSRHPSLIVRDSGDSGALFAPRGRCSRRDREIKERLESVEFLNAHMLYFSPLTRRLLPHDLASLLAASKMKCTLLFSTVAGGRSDEERFTAVCVAQFLPHPTILPKLYQQFYNHFLQLGAYTPSVGLHVTPACAVCVTCGAFLCALDCCDARVPVHEGTQVPNLVLNLRRHAATCGMGLALYLHLSASAVYAAAVDTAVDRDAKWGCLHLDAYGEEDPLLKRGKPLHLSLNRLGRLTDDWRQHQIRLFRRLQWSRMDSSANNHAAQGM
ncbi:Large protein with a UBR1-like ring finger related treble clef, related [Neospora caninum Liverpool]|uniref:E3 ubiquitin-protein ligase n=1 Tax=Neospora caninum (strain Liverpool) TaxID=572307 RepID=F0VF81_NEOCL|nr:Large protein with a UBR1-like ring finger related treble clef, related [Neospora caninum Liverpool]CBZ52375.1 Large protein with a UBR1-like ring finger related treble clef, related [Neospora caninum Liverpool]CEL66346.1 TPA: Large protein with a UBR1-like ring finger related treble clef, related [Neospora caninum Liverpool]|eukprot:XP_003882407.1 Large protein with a UBR1-like ring finger related treble clef, related [Neospora caninum Liverpool]